MKRIVIVHHEMGIFIGAGMGMAFWSLLECAGQCEAVCFLTEEDARSFVGQWEPKQDPDSYRYVEIKSAGGWATVQELTDAGLREMTYGLMINLPTMGNA